MISLTTRWPELRCSTTNPSRRSIDTDKHDVGTDRDELRLCPRRLNSDLSVRLHPPARVHRDGDGPSRWLPAAVLGKTANRRPTRPWAERVIIFINLRLPQLGDPVLNKSNSSPTSSRSSSELDQLSSSRQAHNRGKKISCLRNLDFPGLAKSGTGTGGLNSNDSGSGACPLTARSLCQHPCRKRRERAIETKTPDACKLLQ